MVSIGTVEIGIKLDVTQLDSGVKNLERRLNKIQLVPVVNTKQLHDLNKLLDVKQKHWLETVKLFDNTPIKVNVDGSGLAKAQADIDSLAGKLSAMSATVKAEITHKFEGQRQQGSQTVSAIKELQSGLKEITKAVNSTKPSAIGGAIKGTLGAIVSTPLTIVKGALMGFGQDAIKQFSAGFGDELNKVVTPYVGSLNTLGKRSAKDLERKTKNVITKTNAVYETILDGFSGFEAELELADKENVTKGQKQELKEEIKKKRDIRPKIKEKFVGFANTQSRVEDVLIQSTLDEEESEKRKQSIRKGKRSYSIKLSDQAAAAQSEYLLKQQEYLSKRNELKPIAVSVASKIKSLGDENNKIYSQIAKFESEGDVWEEIPALRSQIDQNALSAAPLIKTRESIISALNSLAADVEAYEKKAKGLANKAAAYKKSFFNDVVMDDNIRIVMQELGVEIPDKLPSVIARKNAKADATYNTMKNQIAVSPELYQRMQSPDFGKAKGDAYGYRVLAHEVTHADDFNYGDNRGIASRAKGRSKGDSQGATIADAFTISGGNSVHGFLSNYRNQPSYSKIRSAEFYAEIQAKQLEVQKFGKKKINPFDVANNKLASAESNLSALKNTVKSNPVLKGLEKQGEILVDAHSIIESKIKELNELSQVDYLSVDDSFIDGVKNKLAETIKTVSQFESSISMVMKNAEDILQSSGGYTSEMQDVESMLDDAFNMDDIKKLQQAKKRIAVALKAINQDGSLNKNAKSVLTSEFVDLQKKAKIDTRTANVSTTDLVLNPLDAMQLQMEKSALQLADKGVELVHAFVDPIIEAVDNVKYMAGQVANNPIGALGAAGSTIVKGSNAGIRAIAPAIGGAYSVASGIENAALSVIPGGHLAKKGLQIGAVTMGLPMAAATIPALAPVAGMLGMAGHMGGAAAGGLAASQMAGISSIPIVGGQVAAMLGGAASGLGTIVAEMGAAAIAVNAVSVGTKALIGTALEPQTKNKLAALQPANAEIKRETTKKTSKLIEKAQNLDLYLPTLPESQRKLVGEYLPKVAALEQANQGDFIPQNVSVPGLKALAPADYKGLDPVMQSVVKDDWVTQYKSAQKNLFEFLGKMRGSIPSGERTMGEIGTLTNAFKRQIKRMETQGKELGFDVSKYTMDESAFKGVTLDANAVEMPDLSKMKKDAVESGKDITKGFSVGAKETSGQVELAFVELAQAGQESFDKEMGIQSPSKWAIERMNFIALGLIVGATKNLPKVKGMGEMTAQEYAKAFKKVIMPDVPTVVFDAKQIPKKQFDQVPDPWGLPKYDVNKLPVIPPFNKTRPETKEDEANRIINERIKKTNELTAAIERKQKAQERVNKLPVLPPIDGERQKHFGKFKTDPYVYLDNNQPTGNKEVDALINRIRQKGIVVDKAISDMVKEAQSSIDSAFDGVASTSNAESRKLIEKVTKTLNAVSLALDNYNFDDGKFIEGSQKSLEQLIDIYSIGNSSSNVSLEDIQAIVKRLTQTLSKQPSTGNYLADMETQLNDLVEAYSIDPNTVAPDSKEIGSILGQLKQKEAELNKAMDLVDQREELVASGYSINDANQIIANASTDGDNWGSPPIPPIFDLIREKIPFIDQAINGFDRLKGTIKNFGMMAVGGIGLALMGKGLYEVGKNALTAYRNLEGVFIASKLLAGSEQYISNLRKQALQLGSDLRSTLEQGIQFSSALVGTPLEAMSQQMFQDFSTSLSYLGLQQQQYDSALLALKQVASKGRVSLEEITGQLGEAVPGIMPLVADALGTNVQGAIQQIESGNVLAEDLLPKLAAGMKNRTAGLAPIYERSLTAATGRMGTSMESLNVGIGEKLAPAVIPAINLISGGIIGLSENVDKLVGAFKYLALGLAGQMIPAIGQAVKSFIAYNGISTLATMSTKAFTAAINVLKLSVKPLLWAFAAISAFDVLTFTFQEKGSQSVMDAIKSIDKTLLLINPERKDERTIKFDFISSGSGFLDFLDKVKRSLDRIPSWVDLMGDGVPKWVKDLAQLGPVSLLPNFGQQKFDGESKRVNQLTSGLQVLNSGTSALSDPNQVNNYVGQLNAIDQQISMIQGRMAGLRLSDAQGNAPEIDRLQKQISGTVNKDGVSVGGLNQQRQAIEASFVPGGLDNLKRNLEQAKAVRDELEAKKLTLDPLKMGNEIKTIDSQIAGLNGQIQTLEQSVNLLDEGLKNLGNTLNAQRLSFINLSGAIAQSQQNYTDSLNAQRAALTGFQISRGLQSQVNQFEDLSFAVFEAEQNIKLLQQTLAAQKTYINSGVIDKGAKATVEQLAGKSLNDVNLGDVTRIKALVENDQGGRLKAVINDSMIGVLEEIATANSKMLEAQKGLQENKKALAQFQISQEDYFRNTARQIYDLSRQAETQKIQDQRSIQDFAIQLRDTSRQLRLSNRALIESYQDLGVDFNIQIATIQKGLADAKDQLALAELKTDSFTITPGNNQSAARQINAMVMQYTESLFSTRSNERQIKIDVLNLEKERVSQLRQIRDLEERQVQAMIDYEAQVRQTDRAFQDLTRNLTDSANNLRKSFEDLAIAVNRADNSSESGKALVKALQNIPAYQPPSYIPQMQASPVSGAIYGIQPGTGQVINQQAYMGQGALRQDEMTLPIAPVYQSPSVAQPVMSDKKPYYNGSGLLGYYSDSEARQIGLVGQPSQQFNTVNYQSGDRNILTDYMNANQGGGYRPAPVMPDRVQPVPQRQPVYQQPKPVQQIQSKATPVQPISVVDAKALLGANYNLLRQLVAAEETNGTVAQMTAVARSVLNRTALVDSRLAPNGTAGYGSPTPTLRGVMTGRTSNGKAQYSPFDDGRINNQFSPQVLQRADHAIANALSDQKMLNMGLNPALLDVTNFQRTDLGTPGWWQGGVNRLGEHSYSRDRYSVKSDPSSVLNQKIQGRDESLRSSLNFGIPESIQLGQTAQIATPQEIKGAVMGGVTGAIGGLGVGALFGGVGAIPGAVMGGIGGFTAGGLTGGFKPEWIDGISNMVIPGAKNQGTPKLESDQKGWNQNQSPAQTPVQPVVKPNAMQFAPSTAGTFKNPGISTQEYQPIINRELNVPNVNLGKTSGSETFEKPPQFDTTNLKDQVNAIASMKQAVEQVQAATADLQKQQAYLQLVDSILGFNRQLEATIRNSVRGMVDQQRAIDSLSRSSKGYLTIWEKANQAGLDVTANYDNQMRSIEDKIREIDQFVDGQQRIRLDTELAIAQAIKDQKPVDGLRATLEVTMGLIDQYGTHKGILENQYRQLDATKAIAASNAQNRAYLQEQLSYIDKMVGLMGSISSAKFDLGGTLVNDAPILQARAMLATVETRANKEGEDLGLSGEALALYVSQSKELAEVNYKKSFSDAIPFVKELGANLKEAVFQTGNFKEAFTKLLDVISSQIFDQLILKPMTNTLSRWSAELFGIGQQEIPTLSNAGMAIAGQSIKDPAIDNSGQIKFEPFDPASVKDAISPTNVIGGLAAAVGFPLDKIGGATNQGGLTEFTSGLQQATIALMAFTQSLTPGQVPGGKPGASKGIGGLVGGILRGDPIGGLLDGIGTLASAATGGMGGLPFFSAADAASAFIPSGGYSGATVSLPGFFKGGMVDDQIQNLAMGGVAGDPLREIGKNAIVALNREKVMGGGKPVLAALTKGEVVVPRNKVPQYLAFERSYQVNGLMAEAKQISNYALGGRVGSVGNTTNNRQTYGGNSMTVVNNTNVSVKDANTMGYSLSQIERRNQIQAERAKRLG